MNIIIRKGTAQDIPGMFRLVKELAEFERAPEAVVNTEAQLLLDGFGDNSIYKVFVAEDTATQQVVGMALYYTAFSTWKGQIFYLDDLVVTEAYRRYGLGRKLIHEVLKAAHLAGTNQIRWQVLDWNTPAVEFYKSLGATLEEEWINCSMNKEQLEAYVQRTGNTQPTTNN